MKLTEDQIKQATLEQITDAEGYDGGELSRVREQALAYYFQYDSAAPSAAGRSRVQSSDVADMVEAVLAQMMPAFAMDNLVEFEATSEDDIEQAYAESEAVCYVVKSQNKGFFEIQSAVKDALLMRNGFVKVYLDEKIDIQSRRYSRLTDDEFGQLSSIAVPSLSDVDNGVQLVSHKERDLLHDVSVKTKTTTRKIAVKAIDPLACSWSREWDSIYLDDVPFFSEYALLTRSDLVKLGYDRNVVAQVAKGGHQNTARVARNRDQATRNVHGVEPSQDLIDFWECYIRLDVDGDGIAELLKVCIAGQTLMEWEEVPYVPYCSGTPFLMPHRFNGMGLFDKMQSIQDAKTAIVRQWLDNQSHANNSRVGVLEDLANMDDVTNSRPGGVVRLQSPDALIPFPYTDIGPSCAAALDYMDKVRNERGGASLDLVKPEAQIAGDTAHGIERQMTAKEQLAAMMTRTLSETLIRTLFAMVHKAMRLYIKEPVQFFSSGEFMSVNPGDWPARNELTVRAGLSVAERMQKSNLLAQVIARQDYLFTNGGDGTMVTQQDIYNATMDWCRAGQVDTPERYFTNPASEEAQRAAVQKQQAAQAAQEYQERLLRLQQQIEDRKANNADAKVFEDARQFDAQLRFDVWKESGARDMEEAKVATDVALELIKNEQSNAESGETDQGQPGTSNAA